MTMETALNRGADEEPLPPEQRLENFAGEVWDVVRARKRPLLIMFYPMNVTIYDVQLEQLHVLLTAEGLRRSEPLPSLDVLLQTYGGDPIASYRLAQIVRDFAEDVTFLVPEFAYSGGTLMCLSAEKILLGDFAVLSPIDIKLVRQPNVSDEAAEEMFPDEEPGEFEVELVAIDHFIQVAKQARLEVESGFRRRGWRTSKTDVESQLLCEMTKQLGVLTIARFYREKNVTKTYAEELLARCMFGGMPSGASKKARIDRIMRRLVVEAPSHELPMDYHLCYDAGLSVEEMPDQLSAKTRALTRGMLGLANDGLICPVIEGMRMPHSQFFAVDAIPAPDSVGKHETDTEERTNGERETRERKIASRRT